MWVELICEVERRCVKTTFRVADFQAVWEGDDPAMKMSFVSFNGRTFKVWADVETVKATIYLAQRKREHG